MGQQPKYAPGGAEDRLYRNDPSYVSFKNKGGGAGSGKVILVILIIAFAVVLFASSFSAEPMAINNLTSTTLNESEMLISFEIENKTIGIVFQPTYTVTVKNATGATIYSNKAEAANYILPKAKQQIMVKAPNSYGGSYEVNLKWKTYKPA